MKQLYPLLFAFAFLCATTDVNATDRPTIQEKETVHEFSAGRNIALGIGTGILASTILRGCKQSDDSFEIRLIKSISISIVTGPAPVILARYIINSSGESSLGYFLAHFLSYFGCNLAYNKLFGLIWN